MGQTLDVIWVAVRAILQVFITTGVGAVMANMGFLGRETLTSLGKVCLASVSTRPLPTDAPFMPLPF